ncbi:hypothetical protein AB0N09_39750 [Streptomyces erythrochromogenes]|uniref:hypothetical protein n=1 Tax=Streptomyces erythrochromogenes TaxID=285574 RepID=UPI00342C9677
MVNHATQAIADYRAAYAEGQLVLGDHASVDDVQQAMAGTDAGGKALWAATMAYGTPAFPDEVAHRYHYYLSSKILIAEFSEGRTVIVGQNLHWTVWHGCEATPDGQVQAVYYFDPKSGMSGRSRWKESEGLSLEGYAVG